MATGGIDVTKHITCAVCFDVYRNPHILQCLHTFCKGCIDQLDKHGKVPCPQCRQVCGITQVRKDFKTQALIDSHHAKQQEVLGQTGSLCGMCGEQGMAVVSHCASCDHVMCVRCQGIHAKMKATKSHPVKSLKELLAKAKAPYYAAIQMLQDTKMNFNNGSKNIASTLKQIDMDKEDKIKQADQQIETIRASIHTKINTTYTNAKTNLTNAKGTYDKNLSSIETKISFLVEIVNNNDLSILQAMERELKGISDEAQHLSMMNPLDFKVLTSPVTLKFKDVHPDTLVDVVLAEAIMNPKQIQQVTARIASAKHQIKAQDFHKIAAQKYKKVGSVETGDAVQRMRMISSQLYCAAWNGGIHVYDTDLTLIGKISSDMLQGVKSVTQCEQTGDLIVACDQGVHQLTLEGDYVTYITQDGEFSDVCCNSRKVYALDYYKCKIRVFERRIDKVWSETVGEQIELKYSNGIHFDKMHVTEDSVFVSSWINNCVHEYSLSSRQHLRQLGRDGRSGPGELYSPRICDVDTQGCMVVCDSGNRRVQVCEGGSDRGGEEKWSCLTLPGLGGYPIDAVVGRDGHTLWVATHHPLELIKYKM